MSHQERLSVYGADVDAEIQAERDKVTLAEGRLLVLEQTITDLKAQLTAADSRATQAESDLAAEKVITQALTDELAAARRTVRRLRKRLAEYEPDLREPIFSAKPHPNTEDEYDLAEVRAGVPYPLHRHYATSHDELIAKAKACRGDICAITYEAYEAATKRLLVIPAKLELLPDRPGIWLGYKHEPEDDIAEGRFTLTEFLSAQTRLDAALQVINSKRQHPIRLDLCLQGPWTWRTRNPDDYFLPGVHTQVGTDPYPAFINRSNPYSVTAEQMFGLQVAWAKDRGVDLWVPEYGIDAPPTAGARAAWIRQMTGYGREHEILAMSYWDHGSNTLTEDDEFAAAGGA